MPLIMLFFALVMMGLTSVADVDFIEGLFIVGGVVGFCMFAESRLLSAAAKRHLEEPRNIVPWALLWLASAFVIYQLFKAEGPDAARRIEKTHYLVIFALSIWHAAPIVTAALIVADRLGFFGRMNVDAGGGGGHKRMPQADLLADDVELDFDPERFRKTPPPPVVTPPVSVPTPPVYSPPSRTLH